MFSFPEQERPRHYKSHYTLCGKESQPRISWEPGTGSRCACAVDAAGLQRENHVAQGVHLAEEVLQVVIHGREIPVLVDHAALPRAILGPVLGETGEFLDTVSQPGV